MHDLPQQLPRRLACRRAFTLAELTIVALLVGIAAALVVPAISNTAEVRLSAATRRLHADLQYAQGYALATRQSIYVRFAANRYEVCTLDGGTLKPMPAPTDRRPFVVQFDAGALRDVSLAAATFGSGDRVLGFDAIGAPFAFAEASAVRTSLAARHEVRLSAGGRTQVIYVEASTGEVRLP